MARIFTPRNYGRLLKHVIIDGKTVTVNGQETVEMLNANFELKRPRDRLVISDVRKVNFPFGIAEFIGLITGESRVRFFNHFIKGYDKYSSDGQIVDGAYGWRLRATSPDSESFQVVEVIKKLRLFSDTRRAVLSIYDGKIDLMGGGGLNTPCTLTIQFLIRDDKLCAITNMRSNDAMWGFNYDLIMFTMLQEFIASQLQIPMGSYYHNAGSFHIYENHYELSRKIMAEKARWSRTMEPMPIEFDYDEIAKLRQIYLQIHDEEAFTASVMTLKTEYAANLAFAAYVFYYRGTKNAQEALLMIKDYTVRRIMRPWLNHRES